MANKISYTGASKILYRICEAINDLIDGGNSNYYLNDGLVGASGGVYVTCNLDKSMTQGVYIALLDDNGTKYNSIFEWSGSTVQLSFPSISGTLTITETTASLNPYSGSYRNIYCDIVKV